MTHVRRETAPAPTPDEVQDVLENSGAGQYALAVTELATRIWWDRGGVGNPYDIANSDPTPRIFPDRLKVLLEEMVHARTLLPVSEKWNYQARSAMVPNPQHGATYYGLTEQVIAACEVGEKRMIRRDEAIALVRQVREYYSEVLKDVVTTPSGDISLLMSIEQFRHFFDLPDPEADDHDG